LTSISGPDVSPRLCGGRPGTLDAMSGWTVVGFVAGLVGLIGGAELLVRGGTTLATRFGIPPVIVGLTVVAFGTGAPELAIGAGAALSGTTSLALGNVVGSNIANVLLVLGAAAAVRSLAVNQQVLRVDIPLLALISVGVATLSLTGTISRVEGALLLTVMVMYTAWLVRSARKDSGSVAAEYADEVDLLSRHTAQLGLAAIIGLLLAGVCLLVIGAELLVRSTVSAATGFGIDEAVIGLTVVAVGTSLPELATSLLAARRGEGDIAVGNAVGSSVFNLLAVLGVTAVLSPGGVPVSEPIMRLDLPVMIAAALVLIPVCWNGIRITRIEGSILFAAYITYVIYLVLHATDHQASVVIAPAAVLASVIAAVVISAAGVQGWRQHRHARR